MRAPELSGMTLVAIWVLMLIGSLLAVIVGLATLDVAWYMMFGAGGALLVVWATMWWSATD